MVVFWLYQSGPPWGRKWVNFFFLIWYFLVELGPTMSYSIEKSINNAILNIFGRFLALPVGVINSDFSSNPFHRYRYRYVVITCGANSTFLLVARLSPPGS